MSACWEQRHWLDLSHLNWTEGLEGVFLNQPLSRSRPRWDPGEVVCDQGEGLEVCCYSYWPLGVALPTVHHRQTERLMRDRPENERVTENRTAMPVYQRLSRTEAFFPLTKKQKKDTLSLVNYSVSRCLLRIRTFSVQLIFFPKQWSECALHNAVIPSSWQKHCRICFTTLSMVAVKHTSEPLVKLNVLSWWEKRWNPEWRDGVSDRRQCPGGRCWNDHCAVRNKELNVEPWVRGGGGGGLLPWDQPYRIWGKTLIPSRKGIFNVAVEPAAIFESIAPANKGADEQMLLLFLW